jgi:hypothetical protein
MPKIILLGLLILFHSLSGTEIIDFKKYVGIHHQNYKIGINVENSQTAAENMSILGSNK